MSGLTSKSRPIVPAFGLWRTAGSEGPTDASSISQVFREAGQKALQAKQQQQQLALAPGDESASLSTITAIESTQKLESIQTQQQQQVALASEDEGASISTINATAASHHSSSSHHASESHPSAASRSPTHSSTPYYPTAAVNSFVLSVPAQAGSKNGTHPQTSQPHPTASLSPRVTAESTEPSFEPPHKSTLKSFLSPRSPRSPHLSPYQSPHQSPHRAALSIKAAVATFVGGVDLRGLSDSCPAAGAVFDAPAFHAPRDLSDSCPVGGAFGATAAAPLPAGGLLSLADSYAAGDASTISAVFRERKKKTLQEKQQRQGMLLSPPREQPSAQVPSGGCSGDFNSGIAALVTSAAPNVPNAESLTLLSLSDSYAAGDASAISAVFREKKKKTLQAKQQQQHKDGEQQRAFAVSPTREEPLVLSAAAKRSPPRQSCFERVSALVPVWTGDSTATAPSSHNTAAAKRSPPRPSWTGNATATVHPEILPPRGDDDGCPADVDADASAISLVFRELRRRAQQERGLTCDAGDADMRVRVENRGAYGLGAHGLGTEAPAPQAAAAAAAVGAAAEPTEGLAAAEGMGLLSYARVMAPAGSPGSQVCALRCPSLGDSPFPLEGRFEASQYTASPASRVRALACPSLGDSPFASEGSNEPADEFRPSGALAAEAEAAAAGGAGGAGLGGEDVSLVFWPSGAFATETAAALAAAGAAARGAAGGGGAGGENVSLVFWSHEQQQQQGGQAGGGPATAKFGERIRTGTGGGGDGGGCAPDVAGEAGGTRWAGGAGGGGDGVGCGPDVAGKAGGAGGAGRAGGAGGGGEGEVARDTEHRAAQVAAQAQMAMQLAAYDPPLPYAHPSHTSHPSEEIDEDILHACLDPAYADPRRRYMSNPTCSLDEAFDDILLNVPDSGPVARGGTEAPSVNQTQASPRAHKEEEEEGNESEEEEGDQSPMHDHHQQQINHHQQQQQLQPFQYQQHPHPQQQQVAAGGHVGLRGLKARSRAFVSKVMTRLNGRLAGTASGGSSPRSVSIMKGLGPIRSADVATGVGMSTMDVLPACRSVRCESEPWEQQQQQERDF